MSLFKYMSAAVGMLFTNTLRIRFTQPFDLNDPFEFRPMLDFEATAAELREVVDIKLEEMIGTVDGAFAMMERQAAIDPNFPKLIAPMSVMRKLISENPVLAQKFREEIQRHKRDLLENAKMAAHSEAYWERFRLGLGQELGILSLIEDPLHTVMWSHYASQHTGIVIEFDEKHPWFSQRRTKNVDLENLVQVTYVANAHPRTWKQVSATDMLYTKTAEWSYEREWRLIRAIMDGVEVSPGITCFDVTPDAIRSITFGCRTQHALEAELRTNVAASPNLRHARFKRVILLGGGKLETVDA